MVAQRVAAARTAQTGRSERPGGQGWIGGRALGRPVGVSLLNAALTPALLRRHAWPDDAGRQVLERAIRLLGLSARAHDGILRVARSIADLEGSTGLAARHVAEAVQYRVLDRAGDDYDH